MEEKFSIDLFPLDIDLALKLWAVFCEAERPVIRKEGSYAAAMEYLIRAMYTFGETQKNIAVKYGVSPGSISRNYAKLYDLLSEKGPDFEEDEGEFYPRDLD